MRRLGQQQRMRGKQITPPEGEEEEIINSIFTVAFRIQLIPLLIQCNYTYQFEHFE